MRLIEQMTLLATEMNIDVVSDDALPQVPRKTEGADRRGIALRFPLDWEMPFILFITALAQRCDEAYNLMPPQLLSGADFNILFWPECESAPAP